MKTMLSFYLVLLLMAMPSIVSAQLNSVILKDGIGNFISNHNSIQNAYNAIPTTLTQAYRIEVDAGYTGSDETFPIVFIDKPGANNSNTITLNTTTNVTTWMNITASADTSSLLIMDNADWVIIDGANTNNDADFRFTSNGFNNSFPLVHLLNGSSNNIIKNCLFQVILSVDTSASLLLGATNTTSGNSYNTITRCHFNLGMNGIVSNGTEGNDNQHNHIYNNTFATFRSAVWQRGGTNALMIDSNLMQQNLLSANNHGFLIENLSDSIFIQKNRIKIYGFGGFITIKGISISNNTGDNSYAWLVNNFILFDEAANQMIDTEDSVTSIMGIELSGNGNMVADIYHNTVRIRGKFSDGGTSGQLGSSAFHKTASGISSIYNVQNNIFTNERIDSFSGMYHLALSIPDISGTININNNTYNTHYTDIVMYGSTIYNNLNSYQSVIGGGNETNSNTVFAEFMSEWEYRLYNSSVNNAGLYGVFIPGITEDTEGDPRVNPYRGADEYIITCANDTPSAFISSMFNNPVCYGTTVQLEYNVSATGNGSIFRWQSRPSGTTQPFTDIPGGIYSLLFDTLYQSMDFRMIDSCSGGLPVDTSNIFTIVVIPLPVVTGISQVQNGYTFDFTATGIQNTTSYLWDFGDGNTDTTASPQHTYASEGNYTVTVIVFNQCGSDTATLQVPVSVNPIILGSDQGIMLYPNPAKEELNISCENGIDIISASISNVTGTEVLTVQNINKTKELKINANNLPTGYYLLRIETGKGITYGRFQILR